MIASDFSKFYNETLGSTVQRLLQRQIDQRISKNLDQRLLGLGFAHPFLKPEENGLSFMLARSGVIFWPDTGKNRSALVDELNLPLSDHCMDTALIVHGLEFSENAEDMLHEVWRVLAPQGKLVLVVPNRRGFWALSDATPFGRGQPFSRRQILDLLRKCDFEVTKLGSALIAPPAFGAGALARLECFAQFGVSGGVLIVEGVKKVHGLVAQRKHKRSLPRLSPMLGGLRPLRKD